MKKAIATLVLVGVSLFGFNAFAAASAASNATDNTSVGTCLPGACG